MRVRELDTPAGPGRVHLHRPTGSGTTAGTAGTAGTVLLGHGAGAGVESSDLQTLTALTGTGWSVALLEQPWRVAGRRVATPPATLDLGTRSMLAQLGTGRWALPRPWVLGGRSAGARVAARLADETSARGVIALSFPLVPPSRPGREARSRAPELLEPVRHGIPLLVVQGSRDPFGGPDRVRAALSEPAVIARAGVEVCAVRGDHGPARDPCAVLRAVSDFLDGLP